MLTTVRDIIGSKNVELNDTIYYNYNDELLDYPITIGNFFTTIADPTKAQDYYLLDRFYEYINDKKNSKDYLKLQEQLKDINKKIKEAKNSAFDELQVSKVIELRDIKRACISEISVLDEEYKNAAIEQVMGGMNSVKFLEYKNSLKCISFEDIVKSIPILKDMGDLPIVKQPLFATGIKDIQHKYTENEAIGLVGGPCLFGIDEVLVKITHKDSKEYLYDFSTGRGYDKSKYSEDINIMEHISIYKNVILNIEYINNKTGITKQEFDSIKYLFIFAKLLDAKVVIPLPDMSYIKFCKAIFNPIDINQRDRYIESFTEITHNICDLYLDTIDILHEAFPMVDYLVLHDRDKELCDKFYNARKPYIENESYVKKITGNSDKLDAVLDYITMLALPYYLYGIKNIIQIDSSDETDSNRKCKQLHKHDINLYGILYPEYLCRDGKNTLYNARLEYKDYMTMEEIRYESIH